MTIKIESAGEMKQVDKLSVLYRDQLVGFLRMNPNTQCCVFQYDKEWILKGFSICPRLLPLSDKLFIAPKEPFAGNFGIFEDSLPDGYGRYLLNRLLKKRGIQDFDLSPIQRLSIVGSSGMGALSYLPETYISEYKSIPDLDELQELALLVLSEKKEDDEELLYFNSGNSGGCRPKCLMNDTEGHWLVKFRHTYDPKDMGKMEYEYNQAARASGIDVPDFKLLKGKYFASKRFDINAAGQREHIATAGALLNESILNPKMDYRNLLALTGFLTQSPTQVEETYRRMIFNILTANKDDHAKNFSFICRDGAWSLAPAYDLTLCANGYNGQHATSVNNSGAPCLRDVLEVGTRIKISRQRCLAVIEEVAAACKNLIQANNLISDL